MSEDNELSRLENEWAHRFDRFTAPEPTREQTLDLIRKIKKVEEVKPVDLRADLEMQQEAQSPSSRVMNLFLSQWNFHGARSWLLTAIVMLVLTITISQNGSAEGVDFITWIKWISLIIIASMSYAFRSKNEGSQLIETLSYTPIIQQMFTRFIIVMVLQVAIALPLSFIVIGGTNSISYVLASITPILFFGVIGFVSTVWLGQKIGIVLTLLVWFSQVLVEKQLTSFTLFQLPGNESFLLVNMVGVGVSFLLLSSIVLKNQRMRDAA